MKEYLATLVIRVPDNTTLEAATTIANEVVNVMNDNALDNESLTLCKVDGEIGVENVRLPGPVRIVPKRHASRGG